MAKERDEARAEQIAADAIVRAETTFVDVSMEEFAELNARLQADQITTDQFNQERERIFGELGLETQ